jgi:hypothetical protein
LVGASAEDEETPISNPVARATSANADSIPFFILDSLLSRLCVLSTFIVCPVTPAGGLRCGAAEGT